MTATQLAPPTKQRFFDNNGAPLAGGFIYTYAAGTTTPIATYTDSTGSTPNPNPVPLNFRGEANIWTLPNVAYKWLATDSAGNTIPGWPIDNIVNSQLITLYGGVDSGVVNAYVLTFTASFTAYTPDGIVVIWIPSHTNTGASTININGLGVINVTNADGSALAPGALTANVPAQILIKGGAAVLQNPFALFQSGTFPVTYTGMTGTVTGTATWSRIGNSVTIFLPAASGTSNANTWTATGIPTAIQPATLPQSFLISGDFVIDNGANLGLAALAELTVTAASGTWIFKRNNNASGWTGANTKGLNTQFTCTYLVL